MATSMVEDLVERAEAVRRDGDTASAIAALRAALGAIATDGSAA